MTLFGGKRDISLFRGLNRELINKWIQQDVGIYKLILEDSKANLYGEAENKVYYRPVKVHCLASREAQSYEGTEFGQNYTSNATFAFLRDDLQQISLFPEVGDIFLWDNMYFEVDALVENQYFVGKNPNTDLTGEHTDWGWNTSLVYTAHQAKQSQLNLRDRNVGTNDENYEEDN